MHTAFPETEAYVHRLLKNAVLDYEALQQKLVRCDLATCHGTCCHDGVYLNPDEARLISQLAADNAETFASYGLNLPTKSVVYSRHHSRFSRPKTATKPVPMSELVSDYPKHFPDTNCVFLDEDGRCGLQRLSLEQERHPWYYKPFTCWMHPLMIREEPSEPPCLTLPTRATDPQNQPGYDGFASQTHCGREHCDGEPAYQVLREELELLGQIAGRDFLRELEVG